ncbi:hypothetical protein [Longirhabdus pacifica]|uniref:hypothetical protein n=1 Tax=Longirhabdus pacifica TaxID=2305227 RepID=UPI001008766B|nr:hypothetical protein [Longirhabdus pacifica]
MKKGIIFGFILMLSIVLTACGGSEGVSVQDDLISFVNDGMAKYEEEQSENLEKFEQSTGSALVLTDEEFTELKKVHDDIISLLDNIEVPETDEVKSLHKKYVEFSKNTLSVSLGVFESFKNGDKEKVKAETKLMNTLRQDLFNFMTELNMLAEEHDVFIEQVVDGNAHLKAYKK